LLSSVYPASSLFQLRRAEENPVAFLERLGSGKEDVVPFRLGRQCAFLLKEPAHIEEVLVKHPEIFEKGRAFDRATRLLGNGLLTAKGILHSQRRRLTQPAFRAHRIQEYAHDVVAQTLQVRDRWREGQVIDVAQEMRSLTLTIAGEAFFGTDLSDCVNDVSRALAMATPQMDGLLSLVAPPYQVRKARRLLEAVVGRVVERRRHAGEGHGDLLSVLLQAKDCHDAGSTQQLLDDCLTFLLAGHDTVAHALTWTWILLAQHPDTDEQLGRETDQVLSNRMPCSQDVTQLTYTKSVLAEALRLFPPAWVIVRRARAAFQLGSTGIPAGAVVVASPFVVHRDPRFFAEPLRFMPARWLATTSAGSAQSTVPRRSFTYFPFGAGSRSCIGEAFAWMEGTLVLATLARRWRFSGPVQAVSPRALITLRPSPPVLMTLRQRQS
jgi:cytochrome P450